MSSADNPISPTPAGDGVDDQASARSRSSLIYCGFCGALNPATNYYCAACGSTLVDAFHASEGLRVYQRPDSASSLVEIVPAGNELDVVEDPDTPEDFVRVRLGQGKLGYVRLSDVEALAGVMDPSPRRTAPDINTNARGCITPTAAVSALALIVVLTALILILLQRSDRADTGVLALVLCVVILPLLLLTIGLYVFSRTREERLELEEEEAAAESASGGHAGGG